MLSVLVAILRTSCRKDFLAAPLQVAKVRAAQVDVILSPGELPTLSCPQVWLMTALYRA